MKYLIPIFLVLYASSSFADDDSWQPCGLVHEGGNAIVPSAGSTSILLRSGASGAGRKSMCYDTDGATNSLMVNIGSCDNVDLKLFNMTDGAFADLSVIARACPSAAASETLCNPIVTDMATATGAEALGYATDYVFVQVETNTNTDDVRVMLRCNGQ